MSYDSNRPSMPTDSAVDHRREEEPCLLPQHIGQEDDDHMTGGEEDDFVLQLTALDEDLINL